MFDAEKFTKAISKIIHLQKTILFMGITGSDRANSGWNDLFIADLRDCWAYLVTPLFLSIYLTRR